MPPRHNPSQFFKYLVFLAFLSPSPAVANNFVQWQAGNVQLLRGSDYEVGEKQRTIATFEYANGWRYGDLFAFMDWTWPDTGKPDYYAEISPRFSLGKIFDTGLSFGPVKDVLISTTFEKPKHAGPRYLYGAALDFEIPGFRYFKANAYVRDDTTLKGDTWQVTLTWNAPFEIHNTKFKTEGFADFAGNEGTSKANQLIVPRLLLDVGHFWGHDDALFIGIEYSHWHNKFGIDGITENAPQAMIQWAF